MKIQKIVTAEVEARSCDMVRDAKGSLWMLFGYEQGRASLVFANEDDVELLTYLSDRVEDDELIVRETAKLPAPLTWVGNLDDISQGQLL